jgi:hypothetical protein
MFVLIRYICAITVINPLYTSPSYVTTDIQSASLSRRQAPIWGPRPDFFYCQTIAGLLMWGAFSVERTGLSFTIAADPRQRIQSLVRVTRNSLPKNLRSQIRDSPNLEGQVPIFIPSGTGLLHGSESFSRSWWFPIWSRICPFLYGTSWFIMVFSIASHWSLTLLFR